MPLPKEFYFAGKFQKIQKTSILFLFLGIIGAAVILFGLNQPAGQVYYVIGAGLLLFTAIYFELTYFIALEIILLAGHGAILLGIGPVLQVILPILLSIQMLVYYLLSGQLKSVFRLIGVIGIALLSIGFSYQNTWIFFFGSLCIATFSFYNAYSGKPIALLWAILNSVFVLNSALILLHGSY